MTHRWMMFESKSTMNMNRAVQELERFNARKKARAVGTSILLLSLDYRCSESSSEWLSNNKLYYTCGYLYYSSILLLFIVVYVNPTLLQAPVFSIPRSTILAIDNFVHASDGPWLHVFNKNNSNAPNSIDGSIPYISSLSLYRMDLSW